jgi:branched-subunit amino acid aminotransferase/4-amino-4-deoxychorismate lyase
MSSVFLNGRFLTPDEARISAFDAGIQHGVGLFETMLGGATPSLADGAAPRPWVMFLDEHLDRLADSGQALGLASGLRTGPLAEAVLETVRRSGLPRARVRLSVTGGDLNLREQAARDALRTGEPPRRSDPTILVSAHPATDYPDAMFDRGVGVVIADPRANPFNPMDGHKTLNYWWRLRELAAAAARGAAEAIVLSITNHIVGGCVSNLFVVRSGELLTPLARDEEWVHAARTHLGEIPSAPPAPAPADAAPAPAPAPASTKGVVLPSPVLPGIVRAWCMRRAEARGVTVRTRPLSIADVLDADEVFLTNSSWGVLPVTRVESKPIGSSAVGPITTSLLDDWRAELAAVSAQ